MKYKLVEAGPFRGIPALFIDEYADEVTEAKLQNARALFGMNGAKSFAVLDGSLFGSKGEAKRYAGKSLPVVLRERGFFVIAQTRPSVIANHVLEANSMELFLRPDEDWLQCRCNAIIMEGVPAEDWYCEDFLSQTPKFLWLQMKGDLQKLPNFLRINSYPWAIQIGSAGPLEVQL